MMAVRVLTRVGLSSLVVVAGATVSVSAGADAVPRSQAPTRLVHGPAILRLTGRDPLGARPYIMIYKLNRDDVVSDTTGPWKSTRGTFGILDAEYGSDRTPKPFGRRGCFSLTVEGPSDGVFGDTGLIKRLAKIPLGGKVKVKLHPLTPGPKGLPKFGKIYISYPRMRRVDAQFKGRAGRRVLKRIGCTGGSLPRGV